MRPSPVIVDCPIPNRHMQMAFVERNQMVETLPTEASAQSLAYCVTSKNWIRLACHHLQCVLISPLAVCEPDVLRLRSVPTTADFSFRMDEPTATRCHRLSARGESSFAAAVGRQTTGLSDEQRRRLAAKGKKLARRVLREVAAIVTPENAFGVAPEIDRPEIRWQ